VASILGLPVVVARALLPVAVEARRQAQAGVALLVGEEEARLPVLGVAAPVLALGFELCTHPTHIQHKLIIFQANPVVCVYMCFVFCTLKF
jgi:hypothetical protein